MKSAIRAFNSILRPARLIYDRNRADRLLLVSPRTSDLVIHWSKRRSHDRDKQTKQTDNTERPETHILLARATDERFVRWTNDLSDGRIICRTDGRFTGRKNDKCDGRTNERTKPNEGYGRKRSSTLGPFFLICEFSFGKLKETPIGPLIELFKSK
jgi:hypothetical protein